MNIYLTFDDGIQPGTKEVLEILERQKVKATFFLTGINLLYSFEEKPVECLNTLKRIYENHSLGNHTFSHANNFYRKYYLQNGVQANNEGSLIDIMQDFKNNSNLINGLLVKALGKSFKPLDFPLAKNQIIPLARFPGRNTSYFSVEKKYDRNLNRVYVNEEKDTTNYSKVLYSSGYEIFGWNLEWKMKFDFHRLSIKKIEHDIIEGSFFFEKNECVHPKFDMFSNENINFDRTVENWNSVASKLSVLAKTTNRLILLMHERAFRNGPDRFEIANLEKLVIHLKERKFNFKTLDKFV